MTTSLNPDFKISIGKDAVAEMPTAHFRGQVRVIDTPEGVEAAIARLYAMPIVGFDTETRPNFHKGDMHAVALMQVSGPDICYLFRINRLGLSDTLVHWLHSPDHIKVGLSLKDDFHQMRKLREFEPGGFVELQTLVRQYHIADASLQKIYAIIFGQRISKSQRLTNWEAPQLTSAQQAYAALDALACLQIYNHLQAGLFIPEDSPFILPSSTESEQHPQ